MNKYRDYSAAISDPARLKFQTLLYQHILTGHRSWDSYDYGEGYYYQGLKNLGVTGLRDTDARIKAMGLKALVEGKKVLEIGCNSGFLSLGIADAASSVTGIDINPYLSKIARESSNYLGIKNVEFHVTSFEDFHIQEVLFECVLSFANHATYDGNTKQTLTDFFAKCAGLLVENGTFIFESHPPALEKDSFPITIELIEQYFLISHQETLEYGTILDSGRTFIVGSRR